MPLVTYESVMGQFRLPEAVTVQQLAGPVASADAEIKSWVGAAIYAEAVLPSPTDPDRFEILLAAGGNLAMAHALPVIAARVRKDGIVKSESSEIARVLSFLSPDELQAQQKLYRESALALAGPYLLATEAETVDAPQTTVPYRPMRTMAVW